MSRMQCRHCRGLLTVTRKPMKSNCYAGHCISRATFPKMFHCVSISFLSAVKCISEIRLRATLSSQEMKKAYIF